MVSMGQGWTFFFFQACVGWDGDVSHYYEGTFFLQLTFCQTNLSREPVAAK